MKLAEGFCPIRLSNEQERLYFPKLKFNINDFTSSEATMLIEDFIIFEII
jgi:hypothetical protein